MNHCTHSLTFSFLSITFFNDSVVIDPSIYFIGCDSHRTAMLLFPLPKQTIYYYPLEPGIATETVKSITSSIEPGVATEIVKSKAPFVNEDLIVRRCIKNYYAKDVCLINDFGFKSDFYDACVKKCYKN